MRPSEKMSRVEVQMNGKLTCPIYKKFKTAGSGRLKDGLERRRRNPRRRFRGEETLVMSDGTVDFLCEIGFKSTGFVIEVSEDLCIRLFI